MNQSLAPTKIQPDAPLTREERNQFLMIASLILTLIIAGACVSGYALALTYKLNQLTCDGLSK